MQEQVTTIYCLCDDFLRATGHKDDPQAQMTTAEVMTVALTAAALFCGNRERSRCFLREHGYIKNMLSRSRLNRRLHAVPETTWQALFGLLAAVHKQLNDAQEYAVGSLPVPACDNIRIRRCRLYPCRRHGGAFRGYVASKRRYFGLIFLRRARPPAGDDQRPARGGDAGAGRGGRRDRLQEPAAGPLARLTHLRGRGLPGRRGAGAAGRERGPGPGQPVARQLPRPVAAVGALHLPPWVRYICRRERKCVETVFSQVAAAFGRSIHAVTPRGLELNVCLTVLAYTITAGR